MKEFDKKNSFKTPEGYFEDFTDRLMDKLSGEESTIPKEEGFAVPEDYFDGLHKSVLDKLDGPEGKVVQLHPYRKYYIAAASIAAVALIFFGVNWNDTQELTFEDLANSDIDAYFENNELGLTSYEIAEVIPVDELEIDDIVENGLDEEYIMDYLDDNIEDLEELNLENHE